MTLVEFHHNVADKLSYSCRLLRKIHARDLRVLVLGEPAVLSSLDAALWSMGPSDFIPHCLATAPAPTLAASPIWLADHWLEDAPHEVVLNLGREVPHSMRPVERFLEVVGRDADDVQAGRQRWKRYKAMGLEVKGIDRGDQ